jgi:hypothetical protein
VDGEIQRTTIDHTGKLKRLKAILNGQPPPEETVEQILARESKRLGMKLEIKKPEKSDG